MQRKRKSKSIYRIRRMVLYFVILFPIVMFATKNIFEKTNNVNANNMENASQVIAEMDVEEDIMSKPDITIPYPQKISTTANFNDKIVSEYGVLVDIENSTILAQRNADTRIYPASLTKVMTLIVAVENIKDMDATFTMTYDILNPLIRANASRAGFEENEKVKLIDMLYGAILPSGADATVGLAEAISGSEAEFVKLMNKKAEEIGLKNTHFMNTSGLHNSNHYSTPVEMAMIMEYALKDDLCRKILSTYKYTTSPTEQHPQGIPLESDMFSRMYGTEVENVAILGGKTGYTIEAGNCLVSFASKDGKEYIAVTTKAGGRYKPIFDSFEIYGAYLK